MAVILRNLYYVPPTLILVALYLGQLMTIVVSTRLLSEGPATLIHATQALLVEAIDDNVVDATELNTLDSLERAAESAMGDCKAFIETSLSSVILWGVMSFLIGTVVLAQPNSWVTAGLLALVTGAGAFAGILYIQSYIGEC